MNHLKSVNGSSDNPKEKEKIDREKFYSKLKFFGNLTKTFVLTLIQTVASCETNGIPLGKW